MSKQTMWILTRSYTNQAGQPLKVARGLKFYIKEVEVLYYPSSEKTKMQISFVVTVKLICVLVFAYAKRWFSHEAAQLW